MACTKSARYWSRGAQYITVCFNLPDTSQNGLHCDVDSGATAQFIG